MSTAWRPLLQGAEHHRAREIVARVATSFRGDSVGSPLGAALLFASMFCVDGVEADYDSARDWLERSIDDAAMGPSLFGGITGPACVACLYEEALDLDNDELLPLTDAALLRAIERTYAGPYDLISGVVGLGLYFLSRSGDVAVTGLRAVLGQLEVRAERTDGGRGLTWFTAPELLPPHQRVQSPDGYYNLGLAHGVPGVIALLGKIYARGVERERVQSLADGAVAWLLARRGSGDSTSLFTSWIPRNGPSQRVARGASWCYGDLGVAVALLGAARAFGRADWEQAALDIGRFVAKSPLRGVVDAALCHGAAGNGHVFNRLWQATGENAFREAAHAAFSAAFDLTGADGSEKGAGYSFRVATRGSIDGIPPRLEWVPCDDFLNGLAGLALSLLAATSAVEPAWDHFLLTAVNPR